MMRAGMGFVVALAACDRGGFHAGGGGDARGDATPSVPIDVRLSGIVASQGAPVANAAVALRGAGGTTAGTATSDATGRFVVEGTVPSGQDLIVDSSAASFAPGINRVPVRADVTKYVANVELAALTSTALSSASQTDYSIMLMGRPAHVIVPAMAGGARLRVAAVDPNGNPPGAMRPAGAADSALQSVGMLYLDVVDGAGNPIAAPAGVRVELAAYTPPSIPDADGFKAWRLDDGGEWGEHDPIAMSPGPGAAPPMFGVDEFGYWNADRGFRTACVKGTLHTSDGMVCSGADATGTGPDGISSHGTSDMSGEFCVTGAQTFSSQVSVGGRPAMSVQMPSNAGDCAHPATCKDIGALTVDKAVCGGDDDGATCSTTQTSGADTPETRVIEMGRTSGTFTFSWNMYTQMDRMTITYGGTTLFDTGCVADLGMRTLSYSGASTQITVNVIPNCAGGTGTAWDFEVSCPM